MYLEAKRSGAGLDKTLEPSISSRSRGGYRLRYRLWDRSANIDCVGGIVYFDGINRASLHGFHGRRLRVYTHRRRNARRYPLVFVVCSYSALLCFPPPPTPTRKNRLSLSAISLCLSLSLSSLYPPSPPTPRAPFLRALVDQECSTRCPAQARPGNILCTEGGEGRRGREDSLLKRILLYGRTESQEYNRGNAQIIRKPQNRRL